MNAKQQERGFSILELTVASGAIVALAGLLIPIARQASVDSDVAVCLANMRSLMQATNLYLDDHNDWYPPLLHQYSSASCIDTWSYGGKTNDSWWLANSPCLYREFADRLLNPYILGEDVGGDVWDDKGNLIYRAEVPALQCPADVQTYTRTWESWTGDPAPISTYDDVGTSYHFNLIAVLGGHGKCDVRRAGMVNMENWLWFKNGWNIMLRDLVRDARYKLPGKYAMYFEDPMEWALTRRPKLLVNGNHGAFSTHSAGFIDGHAENRYFDTRKYCGDSWYALNPEWIAQLGQWPPPPKNTKSEIEGAYYYTNPLERNCQ